MHRIYGHYLYVGLVNVYFSIKTYLIEQDRIYPAYVSRGSAFPTVYSVSLLSAWGRFGS